MSLAEIVAHKRDVVAERRKRVREARLAALAQPTSRSLRQALLRPGPRFLFECKKASPSAGLIRPRYDAATLARRLAPWADALSILTEERYFGGSLADLEAVRSVVDLPLLRKDVVVDPYEVVEARVHGADAVLLMLSVLDDATYVAARSVARRYGMDILTEVHDAQELERARRLGADLIGINNRDLRTFDVDLGTVPRLAAHVPPQALLVAESGYARRDDILAVAPLVDAFLVGGSIMAAEDPTWVARTLLHGLVKVCGLTLADDARLAYRLGATHGGLNFVPTSPRRLDLATARAICEAAPLAWVAVVADATNETIETLVRELPLSAVQLHGHEDAQRQRQLRELLPPSVALWKAIDTDSDPQTTDLAADDLDLVIFDRRGPHGRGGNGRIIAPERLAVWQKHVPRFGLAGGLDATHASWALSTGAILLDVNSRVERAPGIKDPDRLTAFFSALRHQTGKRTTTS